MEKDHTDMSQNTSTIRHRSSSAGAATGYGLWMILLLSLPALALTNDVTVRYGFDSELQAGLREEHTKGEMDGCGSNQPEHEGQLPEPVASQKTVNSAEKIIQSVYTVAWKNGEKSYSAKAVVHQKGDTHYSLALLKGSRRLLTVWAKEQQIWIYFPREKRVYVGCAETAFPVFNEVPPLSFRQWLDLLQGRGDNVVVLGSDHYGLSDQNGGFLIWKLKRQKVKKRVQPIVFEPAYPEKTSLLPLAQLSRDIQEQP